MADNRRMVTKKPKGLGLGLEALLGPKVSEAPAGSMPTSLNLKRLHTGRYQPRTRMDEGALNEGSVEDLADLRCVEGLLEALRIAQGHGPGPAQMAGESVDPARLAHQPGRFILFADDLSFESGDAAYKPLKAALVAEGLEAVLWQTQPVPGQGLFKNKAGFGGRALP